MATQYMPQNEGLKIKLKAQEDFSGEDSDTRKEDASPKSPRFSSLN